VVDSPSGSSPELLGWLVAKLSCLVQPILSKLRRVDSAYMQLTEIRAVTAALKLCKPEIRGSPPAQMSRRAIFSFHKAGTVFPALAVLMAAGTPVEAIAPPNQPLPYSR